MLLQDIILTVLVSSDFGKKYMRKRKALGRRTVRANATTGVMAGRSRALGNTKPPRPAVQGLITPGLAQEPHRDSPSKAVALRMWETA